MAKKNWKVPFTYLDQQFAHPEKYFTALTETVLNGDFTLGKKLVEFESNFAKKIGVKYAIGVNSGTDALYLSLKALGIGSRDEVITAPNSFIATAAIIALTGAKPVFADVRDDYNIDPNLIEAAINSRTRAILPVHLTGIPADMYPILEIAKNHKLAVIEDAAQAALAKYDKKFVGTFGKTCAFSLHPLKILHVWGDGGIITTDDSKLAQKLRLWRNHGLLDRDHCEFFAHNSRLHTIQAAIANMVLPHLEGFIAKRRKLASLYNSYLKKLYPWVQLSDLKIQKAPISTTFTTYVIQVKKRDRLIEFLTSKGIEVKVHYPIPIHLQKAAKYLGFKKGDFPVCEKQAETILSLPCHQYLSGSDVDYVCESIKEFYV